VGENPKEADPQIRVVDRRWREVERGKRAVLADRLEVVDVSDAAQDETVVAVMREGYAIGDDLLRPASVILGRLEPRA
jgi:hypothetical protein